MGLRLSSADHQDIVQIAYHVRDLDSAIARWNAATGLGPFLVRRHIQLSDVRYSYLPSTLDISAAFVQSGDIQVEFIHQHCDLPRHFVTCSARSEEGFHHVAIAPSDRQAMLDHYQKLGFDVASDFHTLGGGGASYVDARGTFGHMIEIYDVSERIKRLYDRVADAAAEWDGRELVVEI